MRVRVMTQACHSASVIFVIFSIFTSPVALNVFGSVM